MAVNLLSFLLGLAIGGLALLGYRMRLRQKVDVILHNQAPKHSGFSLTSRLAHVLNDVQQHHLKQQAEILAWKNVINQGPMGYLLIDEDNQLIDCNHQALDLLNIQLDFDAYRLSGPRLLLELVRSYELDQLIEQARERQQFCQKEWPLYPVSADVENVSTTQKISHLRGYAFPLTNSDITVLLESRQEAVFLSQQRDRWASDVAHELKTPLTSIRLVAETLQSRLEPPLRGWVDRLLVEVIRLSTLVQEILDLSQLESLSERKFEFSTIDVPSLIESAWRSLEPLATDYDVSLHYEGPQHFMIQGEESRLFRVLINLFDNSLKFSSPQQIIQIKLRHLQPSHEILIELIDAGPGFPEADLPLIFDRFYRGDPSRTRAIERAQTVSAARPAAINQVRSEIRAGSGSGLGLSIVRQIIELHNGHIIARNHPKTGGAWIQIHLPVRPTLTPPATAV